MAPVSRSTRLVASVLPGIEFDVFPYSESSKRSLTIQYNIGGSFHDYEQVTIFDRLKESVAEHSVNASLGLDQPWGSAGGSINFTQQLSSPDRTRVAYYVSLPEQEMRMQLRVAAAEQKPVEFVFTTSTGATKQ